MTGAVEKVAAANDLDLIERRAARFGWDPHDVPKLIAEVKGLRNWADHLDEEGERLAASVERMLAKANAAEMRAEAAEARNAAVRALCDSHSTCGEPYSCDPTRLGCNGIDEIREALGGETATTREAEPCHPDMTTLADSRPGLCADCGKRHKLQVGFFRETATRDEGPEKGSSNAVQPRSGGERESGRVADSDTAESHVDLSAFDHGTYDETPQRWRTEWREGHPVAPRQDDAGEGR